MVFASELAAFVGRNKYQDPASAAAKIWQRTNPATYAAAEARVQVFLRSDEDVVDQLGLGLGLAAAVDATDECGADAKVDALLQQPLMPQCPAALARDLADAVLSTTSTDKADHIVKAVSRAAGGPLTAAATQTLRQQAVHLVTRALSTAASASASASVPGASTSSCTTPEALRTQEQVLAQVREQVQVLAQSVRVQDREDAAVSVQAAVNKARGTAREPEALDMYEQQTGSSVRNRNDRFYLANLGTAAEPCWLGGRVDGLCGDRVVEVKCRRNRFFRFLPEYEKVQIHAYMHLTGKRECEVVQKFDGQVRADVHRFDHDFWARVRQDACTHWGLLLRVFDDEQLQDELLRSCVA